MKRIFFILLLIVGITAISAQDKGDKKAKFKFETETIDYGKIPQKSDGVRVFKFTNTGEVPLVISRVQASCGCTVPKKPEKPIMPGEQGEIEVSYNTHTVGGFSKMITVFSNAENPRKRLRIKGVVEKTGAPTKEKNLLETSN